MSENPILIPQAFASNGSKNTIQNTRQTGQDPEDATWSEGFPNVTMQPMESGGLPPKGMDFNGILHALSASIVHQQKGGFFYFDSNHANAIGGYSTGAILIADDHRRLFISTIDKNKTNPNQNPTGWKILAGEGVNATTATKLQTARQIGGVQFDGTSDVHLPISIGFNSKQLYQSGDLVKIDGVYYECYHPDGAKGKDPRDPVNRPAGWQITDPSQPYYWLKIGKWLSFPEVGSPIYLPTTFIREGLIKYRNDGQLHKNKFWRLAELYPELINKNVINIADLRAEFLRGLDDGRGLDMGRVVNASQKSALQEHNHYLPTATGTGDSIWCIPDNHFIATDANEYPAEWSGTPAETFMSNSPGRIGNWAGETRPRNVAMLIATRI